MLFQCQREDLVHAGDDGAGVLDEAGRHHGVGEELPGQQRRQSRVRVHQLVQLHHDGVAVRERAHKVIKFSSKSFQPKKNHSN